MSDMMVMMSAEFILLHIDDFITVSVGL
jgi:hypothetical protein